MSKILLSFMVLFLGCTKIFTADIDGTKVGNTEFFNTIELEPEKDTEEANFLADPTVREAVECYSQAITGVHDATCFNHGEMFEISVMAARKFSARKQLEEAAGKAGVPFDVVEKLAVRRSAVETGYAADPARKKRIKIRF